MTNKQKIHVLVIEPAKKPYAKEIPPGLSSLQKEVGGDIQAIYPYEDPVAIICDDEGKLKGSKLNRALRNEDGEVYDIIAGTFLVVGLGERNFTSLESKLMEKFANRFHRPETFISLNGNIVVLPMQEDKPKARKLSIPDSRDVPGKKVRGKDREER